MVPEELITLTQVLVESGQLRAWFTSLAPLSPTQRAEALVLLATRMETGGEDQSIIATIRSLTDHALFEALLKALDDLA